MTKLSRRQEEQLRKLPKVSQVTDLRQPTQKSDPKLAILSLPGGECILLSWCNKCNRWTGQPGEESYPVTVCHTSQEHSRMIKESNRKKPSPKTRTLSLLVEERNRILERKKQKEKKQIAYMREKRLANCEFTKLEWKQQYNIREKRWRAPNYQPNLVCPYGEIILFVVCADEQSSIFLFLTISSTIFIVGDTTDDELSVLSVSTGASIISNSSIEMDELVSNIMPRFYQNSSSRRQNSMSNNDEEDEGVLEPSVRFERAGEGLDLVDSDEEEEKDHDTQLPVGDEQVNSLLVQDDEDENHSVNSGVSFDVSNKENVDVNQGIESPDVVEDHFSFSDDSHDACAVASLSTVEASSSKENRVVRFLDAQQLLPENGNKKKKSMIPSLLHHRIKYGATPSSSDVINFVKMNSSAQKLPLQNERKRKMIPFLSDFQKKTFFGFGSKRCKIVHNDARDLRLLFNSRMEDEKKRQAGLERE